MAREKEELSEYTGPVQTDRGDMSLNQKLMAIFFKEDLNEDQKLDQIREIAASETIDEQVSESIFKVCEKGYLNIFKFFYDKNNEIINFRSSNFIEPYPIHIIAKFGHRDIVEFLISIGADLNKQDNFEKTALMFASEHGHADVAKLLITHRDDIDRQDNFGKTALMFASKRGHREVAELLITHRADIDKQDNNANSALMLASKHGHADIAELLITHKADLDKQDKFGKTALMFASEPGHAEVTKLLITHRADLNKQDYFEKTALMFASQYFHPEIVELLISHGGDLNKQDCYGNTVLMRATNIRMYLGYPYPRMSDSDIKNIDLLIKYGADLSLINSDGQTASDIIFDPELRAKYKKLEQSYITIKPIIDKIISKEALSVEEKSLLKNFEEFGEEDSENIIECIFNITRYEIRKMLIAEKNEQALELIDTIFDQILFEEFKSYKTMIHQYRQIKGWGIKKSITTQKHLPNQILKIIGSFLNFKDTEERAISKELKSAIQDARDALLKFDFETMKEIYKDAQKIFDIQEREILTGDVDAELASADMGEYSAEDPQVADAQYSSEMLVTGAGSGSGSASGAASEFSHD